MGEVPETDAVARVDVIVVDDRPGEANQFVLGEHGLHRALRTFARRIVERRDPEFEHQFPGLARLEVVVVGGVGVGQLLDVLRAAPSHSPILVPGRREDVIILRVHAVKGPVGIGRAYARIDHGPRLADGFGRPDVAVINIDERSARQISIHHYLEDVVVQIRASEIPVVVVNLV
jgi:hypothetical protein